MKVDNAMHILLITISSLVLINSIIWLCLDNIGKDKNRGKGKDEEYNKIAKELRHEIGDDSDTIIKSESIDYSNCVVGDYCSSYENYYFNDTNQKYLIKYKELKSNKFIHIDVNTYHNIRIVNDYIHTDSIHINVSRLKFKDPRLARVLISMVRPDDEFGDYNMYNKGELLVLRNFLMSDSIQSNYLCRDVIDELISTIDYILDKEK